MPSVDIFQASAIPKCRLQDVVPMSVDVTLNSNDVILHRFVYAEGLKSEWLSVLFIARTTAHR